MERRAIRLTPPQDQELFFRVTLPTMAVTNLGLGLAVLLMVTGATRPVEIIALAVGGFCCAVGGWLLCAGWSKSYWSQSMALQTAAWHRAARTILRWLEEMPVPAESLRRLQGSLADATDVQAERRD